MLQNRPFFALAPRSGFGGAISGAVARNSIVFCNSTSRYRIVMAAASRLLGAAAACVMLLSFATGQCKSYWSGCIKLVIMFCHVLPADFLNFGAGDFRFKIPFKNWFNIVLFLLWRRDPVLELQFLAPLRVVPLRFAMQYLEIAM